MDNLRFSEWVDNSDGLRFIDILLIGNAQGLGLLDVDLIEEFPKLLMTSEREEDKLKKLRHITLSELWLMGSYELVRLIYEILPKNKDFFGEDLLKEAHDTLKLFTEVRVPLAKFQKWGNNELYSGVPTGTYDSNKGIGWKVHFSKKFKIETKIFYRKDLSDALLNLLKGLRKRNLSREK